MLSRRAIPALYVALVAAAISSCDDGRFVEYELSGATMGTSFSVKLVAPPDDVDREKLQQDIRRTLERIEDLMSTYRAESELSAFNANLSTDWFGVSAELCAAIEQALSVCELTGGAFDVTIAPLVNLWGFGPGGTISTPPSGDRVTEALTLVGHSSLETRCATPALRKRHPGIVLDLSGWAKGYAVDELADLLDERTLTNYLVEIGGELRLRGHNAGGEAWSIAIERPVAGARGVQTVVRLTDAAVATSGDYRNFFERDGVRYSHTIDPRTGRPVEHELASVTVIDESAAFADGMATGLLVLGPDAGLELATGGNLAAYFLVRAEDGFEERMTPAFRAAAGLDGPTGN